MAQKKTSPFDYQVIGNGENKIEVWKPTQKNPDYTAIYQNCDTRELDRLFGLSYKNKSLDDTIRLALDKAIQLTSLGHTNVERLMRYFVSRAKIHHIFVGLPVEELRTRMELRTDYREEYRLKPEFIEQALRHYDTVLVQNKVKMLPYFKLETVQGIKVIFPVNLRKL